MPTTVAAIERYVKFCYANNDPTAPVVERHHVIMRKLMPKLAKHKYTIVKLTPKNHLMAHYFLTLALPESVPVLRAFNLLSDIRATKNQTFSPEEITAVAEAYEVAKLKLRPSYVAHAHALNATPEWQARHKAHLVKWNASPRPRRI
jgi:hypothetical protein